MTDLVAFGETLLRLSPPAGRRLSRTDALEVHVGGAESNVAVAAANLGCDAAWLSRLPESPLGERVAHALRGEGVDPAVDWADAGRVGTYYFEPAGDPRGSTVVYDRAGAAIREATADRLPVERIPGADLLFTSGITPALSDRLAETTDRLLDIAGEAGVRTALDLNYREKLWAPAAARETLVGLFPAVDVLLLARRDARDVLGRDGDPADVARGLRDAHGFETVVLTCGADGAVAAHDGLYDQPAFPADTVDRVGSGDALAGAYLAGRIDGKSVPAALADGAAAAALKRTVAGDAAPITPAEVEAVVAGGAGSIDR